MSRLSILYDGWALAHQPNHPAAIHLLTLLHYHPPEIPAIIALPSKSMHGLADSLMIHTVPTLNHPRQRLTWEQRLLPKLARQNNAALIHLTSPFPALVGQTPILISPCEYWSDRSLNALPTERGLIAHLRTALGQGGLSQARAILWPDDLPEPGFPAPKIALPPVVHPAFLQKDLESQLHQRDFLQSLDISDSYILYHGPGDQDALERLLAAWSWAAEPIGESTPLVILGLDPEEQARCSQMAKERGFETTLRLLPSLPVEDLAALYRGCNAVFHPAPYAAWGGTIRAALACGKPLVACETPALGALVGKAAYLVPADLSGSSRAFGAAVITIVVEESVGEGLSRAARQLSQNWKGTAFAMQLSQLYQQILVGG